MKAIFVIFVTLTILTTQTSSYIIDCDYEYGNCGWSRIFIPETFYYCKVKNPFLMTGVQLNIDSVLTHFNEDIKGIWIDGANIEKFPTNLENIFENLIAIKIRHSNLKEINYDDLKVFPDLKYLDLLKNRIKVLKADLFLDNLQLEGIGIQGNRIEYIDEFTFSHLKKLRFLTLQQNFCEFEIFQKTRIEVEEIVKKIEEGLCSMTHSTTQTIRTTTKISKQKQFERKIENLKLANAKLMRKIKEIEKIVEEQMKKINEISDFEILE
ncbi:hypothetical protein PVAND_017517 [Polypedilum vanderplanki]|uniref:Uncharacterized protein n=1 Tax=Polypedilum vanderplanki TaxID=319348 RepID=A0A9J6BIB5_POLVA|nr:hypothetical protein PVAND_017517 [Polypedilum vanderplanki]